MVNDKQIEFTYRNNFFVQACACISQRSLTGSEMLHFFFLFLPWSCLLCGAGLSFWSRMVLHSLTQWALGLVMKSGTWEIRVGAVIHEFLTVTTNAEQPSWVRSAVQLVAATVTMSRHWQKGRCEANTYDTSFQLQDLKYFSSRGLLSRRLLISG